MNTDEATMALGVDGSQPEVTEGPIPDLMSLIEDMFMTFISVISGQSTQEATDGSYLSNHTTSDICTTKLYTDWFGYMFIPSVLILIVLSFLQKRKRMFLSCFYGYPGIAHPVDIIDAGQDRLSYACAFGATTSSVLGLLGENYWINIDLSDTPELVQGTLNLIMKMVNVLLVGVVFYPIFACLTTNMTAVGSVFGILYSMAWLAYYILNLVECSTIGVTSLVATLFMDLPNIVCLLILSIRFAVGIGFSVYNCCLKEKKKVLFKDENLKDSRHYIYVKRLLNPPKNAESPTCWDKFKKMLYQNKPGFKYSTRIVCTMTVAGIVLAQLSTIWCLWVLTIIEDLQEYITDPKVTLAFTLSNYSEVHQDLVELAEVNMITFNISYWFTLALHYVFLVLLLVNYRQHMLMLYRGNKSPFPTKKLAPANTLVYSWRYAGYQVAYLMWSWFVWHIVCWIICFLAFYFIIFPLRDGASSIALDFIKSYWLTLVFGFVLIYFQVFVAKLIFLQDRGAVLGADNRRLFSVMFYVLFYYDMIIGLFSCLMRIIYGAVFGLTFLGRTDNSVLMRKFELWDPGFKAYYGFLLVEEYHTHPVLVTFSKLLLESSANNLHDKSGVKYRIDEEKIAMPDTLQKEKEEHPQKNIARNRWHLSYTLIKNPGLIKRRGMIQEIKEVVDSDSREEIDQPSVVEAVENGATTMMAAASF